MLAFASIQGFIPGMSVNNRFGALILATKGTVATGGPCLSYAPLGETGIRGHQGDVVAYRIDRKT